MTPGRNGRGQTAVTFDARTPDGTLLDVAAMVLYAAGSMRAVGLDPIRNRGGDGRAVVPPPGRRRELFRLATAYAHIELASAAAAAAAAPTVIEI